MLNRDQLFSLGLCHSCYKLQLSEVLFLGFTEVLRLSRSQENLPLLFPNALGPMNTLGVNFTSWSSVGNIGNASVYQKPHEVNSLDF